MSAGQEARVTLEAVDIERERREREFWKQHVKPLDMEYLMSQPRRQVRYRVDGFARDGALTALCGAAGSGKSWFGMGLCAAVQSGRSIGGMPVERGNAVYVDGEMGADQMVDRFRDAWFPHDAFGVLDVQGLDLGQEAGIAVLQDELLKRGANFVVLDSMRRLSPGKRENESDDMGSFVARLARLARDTKAAVVVLHHTGHGLNTQFARGSSAIADQVDAVFGYVIDGELRRLSCDSTRGGKFRFGREPRDRFFRPVQCEPTYPGTVVIAEDRGDTTTTTADTAVRRETQETRFVARIPDLILSGLETTAALAADLGVHADNKSLRNALNRLISEGEVQREGGVLSVEVDS